MSVRKSWIGLLAAFVALGLGALVFNLAEAPSEGEPRERPPLVAKPLALPPHVHVRPALGAVEPRPVLIFLGEDQRCQTWGEALAHRGHLLCASPRNVGAPGRDAGLSGSRGLRAGLAELKRVHGEYVAPSPVVLVAEGAAVGQGLELAQQEPSFFATLVLGDASSPRLKWTPSFFESFVRRGGRAVVWRGTTPLPPVVARAGKRAGLTIVEHPAPRSGELGPLISRLIELEPRLQTAAPAPGRATDREAPTAPAAEATRPN